MAKDFEEIGRRIRTARKKLGYSQADLSEILDISPSYMSDIENGKTNIGLDIFIRMAEALHVSADWLLQIDMPTTNRMNGTELGDIFENCTVKERKLFLKVLKEHKMAHF